jgi:hypothetical protein
MTRRLALVSLLVIVVLIARGPGPAATPPEGHIAILNGYGPRVAEPALGLIRSYLFSAPYEEVRLKAR